MDALSLLVKAVVLFHGLYAAFIVIGLVLILVGAVRGWGWVRNFWFRAIHLAMIAVVVIEGLCGIDCPLTVLESHLRETAGRAVGEEPFLDRMVHQVLFLPVPPSVILALQYAFGAAVAATLLIVPPKWPRWLRREKHG